ncbi:MAG: type IV pilin N-terminal domain-containing protein [Archaeoglobaceae archaeon]|nr:type IV pilin N-terminal domain-containing protein [Archaeoglobaceae archaeon]MDW8013383.1 type IV pilin N-terminal domain-containing protein [Archaeoglobaceae archaeon]
MRRDEKGVSPVIGVILMVAITVILAAVVASFVFGLGGTVKRSYNVAFTVSAVNASHAVVTFQGGPDVAFLDTTDACKIYKEGTSITGGNFNKTEVGKSITIGLTSGETVTVVCDFIDGTKQVMLTYTRP